ncbi:hypothetical protein EKG37_13710 [Robertmurraya yapensis]|uniref:UGSC-like domain-containing protein n=2 Tax=Bacillus yapensis TaxID=2492960 RepID=A0A431W3E0_9BACI|nr:hypothetical protein EKG37_13710 [Bacillus yapensis]TKS95036.1 hypothetical protein FAR12_13710 [Bacillus yapensis]
MGRIDVLNPVAVTGMKDKKDVSKLEKLEGKAIAFLDNLKPQSDQVLFGIRDYFEKRGIRTKVFRKIDTPTAVPEPVVQEIKEKYHAVITGVGD